MNIDEIVFGTFVICPLCKRKMKTLSGTHLIRKHGYTGIKEFKIEFKIPLSTALVSHSTRKSMQSKGKLRSGWFRKNVMPIGIEYAKKADLVPKEIRKYSGELRKGRTWIKSHVFAMKDKGWLDLHDAAALLGIAYNYSRKCASDGRIKTITDKGIRFTRLEWIEEARKLLQENRNKYRPDLVHQHE